MTSVSTARTQKGCPRLFLAMAISLVAVLAIGCGTSRDEFVFAGPGGPGAETGTLTFLFTQPQAQVDPTQVPAGTVRLAFEFFEGENQTGAKTLVDILRDYNPTVVITGVPPTTRSVRVTAIGGDGIPLAIFTTNVTVVAGGNVEVGLGQGTPVAPETVTVLPATALVNVNGTQTFTATIAFDNGAVVSGLGDLPGLVWGTSNPEVASVSGSGVATGLSGGTSEISASYGSATVTPGVLTVNELPPLSTLTSLEITADSELLAVGEEVQFTVVGTFVEGDTVTEAELASTDGVVLTTQPATQTVLEFSTEDLSATGAEAGEVTVFASVDVDGTPLVSEEGVAVEVGELQFRLFAPDFHNDEVIGDIVGDILTLPSNGFQYRFLVEATHPDQSSRILGSSELADFGLSFSVANSSVASFVGGSPDTVVTTDLGVSDFTSVETQVEFLREGATEPLAEFVLQAVKTSSSNLYLDVYLGDQWRLPKSEVLLTPAPYNMQVGDVDRLRVMLSFQDGSDNYYYTDITSSPQLVLNGTALTGNFVSLVNASQFLEALMNTTQNEPLDATVPVNTTSGLENPTNTIWIFIGEVIDA